MNIVNEPRRARLYKLLIVNNLKYYLTSYMDMV